MASIRLKWVPLQGADIVSYKIHRSIIGFTIVAGPSTGLINGDTLSLNINSVPQTITFLQDYDTDGLISFLNSLLVGAIAYKSLVDPNNIIIRSDIRTSPGFIEIIGGTSVDVLGLTTGVISEKSHVIQIATINSSLNSFEDLDGVIQDFYGISTIDSLGNESTVSTLTHAVGFSTPICVVEGKVIDLQGKRLADIVVVAKIVAQPQITSGHSAILTNEMSVLTGEDGRFSLPLLQGSEVIFEINSVRMSDPLIIPAQDFVYFDDLPLYSSYQFTDTKY